MTPSLQASSGDASSHSEIRRTLRSKNLTVAALCRLSGVRYQLLINILNGYQRPSPEVMKRTAQALGLSPVELWGSEAER